MRKVVFTILYVRSDTCSILEPESERGDGRREAGEENVGGEGRDHTQKSKCRLDWQGTRHTCRIPGGEIGGEEGKARERKGKK